MTAFPLTQPIRPFDHDDRIRRAAATLDPHRWGERGARKSASTIDRTRLKLPWLTVFTAHSTYQGAWQEVRRAVIRFYFNRPALDRIVPPYGDERTVYLSIERQHGELLILSAKGGWPMTVTGNISASCTQRFIAGELERMGYLLDGGETTYFPLRPTAYGFVADLSTAYTKADAVAHEEALTCRDHGRSSATSRRPAS
jgi:hypothetical protein